MRKDICVCDLCKEIKETDDIYTIKVKSVKFVNYLNYDDWGSNRKDIDICQDCVDAIKMFIKCKKEVKNG